MQAGHQLSSGFHVAANELFVRPSRSLREEGLSAAMAQAIRGAPSAAAANVSAAAGAVRTTLLGARNTLDKDHYNEKRMNA